MTARQAAAISEAGVANGELKSAWRSSARHRLAAGADQEAGEGEAAREALIEAGRELFARFGYSGVGLEDIVARAEVDPRALKHHFGGQRDLFVAVCERIQSTTAAGFEDAINATGADPGAALGAAIEVFLDASQQTETRQLLRFDAPTVLDSGPLMPLDSARSYGLLRQALVRFLGQSAPTETALKARVHLIHGALFEAGVALTRSEHPEEIRPALEAGLKQVLAALRVA